MFSIKNSYRSPLGVSSGENPTDTEPIGDGGVASTFTHYEYIFGLHPLHLLRDDKLQQ